MQEQIVQFLKNHQGYLSGEEISRALKISRAAIWKYMQELRNDGYDIVAVPHLGYQLVSAPDKLFPHEIKYQLATKKIGKNIVYYDSIPSTMDEAFKLGMQNAEEGTVVVAETQTKGRGRMGRSWMSPKGKGIYFSVVFRPRMPLNETAQLTLLSAVAVVEAVYKTVHSKPSIKWPNDLLLNNRKIAGILTELSAELDRVKFVVVGIGLNVNTALNQLPPGATSLKSERGENYSRVKLLQEILRSLEFWYERLKKEGFKPIVREAKESSATLRRRIVVSGPEGNLEGEAIDIDQDGGLLIRKDSGIVVKKLAGDIVQVG